MVRDNYPNKVVSMINWEQSTKTASKQRQQQKRVPSHHVEGAYSPNQQQSRVTHRTVITS